MWNKENSWFLKLATNVKGSFAHLLTPALETGHWYKSFIHTRWETQCHSHTSISSTLYFSWVLECLCGPLWQWRCLSPDSQEGGVGSLCITGSECSAEHTVAVSTLSQQSTAFDVHLHFFPAQEPFQKIKKKIHRTSAYLVWSWHWIKEPWMAHQETRRNTGVLKCVCCYVQ